MNCDRCDDTGSLSKDPEGYLDCPHCEVADERAELERWASKELKKSAGARTWVWTIYQHGKTAALNT